VKIQIARLDTGLLILVKNQTFIEYPASRIEHQKKHIPNPD